MSNSMGNTTYLIIPQRLICLAVESINRPFGDRLHLCQPRLFANN